VPKGGYRHGDLVIYPPTSTQDDFNLVITITWNPLLVMHRAGRSFVPVILLRLGQSITNGFGMRWVFLRAPIYGLDFR
jgi:hypothetical protein